MGLMDSMIAGGALANGVLAFQAGPALWVLLMVTLVGSALGIVTSAYRRRPFDWSALRRPQVARLSHNPNQLCEARGA